VISPDSSASLKSLCDAVYKSKYRGRLLLIIDEYDSSLNNALLDKPLADELSKRSIEGVQSAYRQLFGRIKDGEETGTIGRIVIAGVVPLSLNDFTSGFNTAVVNTNECSSI
jgi:hypothetical protein